VYRILLFLTGAGSASGFLSGKENLMERIKSKIFVGLAALALAGGTIAATEPAGHAATTACGATCVALASQALGTGSVSAVSAGTTQTGRAIILSAAGQFSTEDFTQENPGTVAEFYQAGVFGPAVGETWPSYPVYEYQYTPDGSETGLCLGIATTAADGVAVTLQPCGVTAKTTWIPLEIDDIGGVQPLINGSDTDVNTPFVLTTSASGNKLTTHKLDLIDGTFNPAQMWQDVTGVL
jgi:hypothetical protein